ncbi:MAG: response regulator [Proteobacteria bacterium]|nr:response regulator [Pseudomonadota bacterium]MBU1737122.1 response regulator [Pseudomonadota bacterium]
MSDKTVKKKILIVDDEEDMIWSLQKNLNNENLQAEIMTASSGEEALEILNSRRIDLVITDIKMPGISGLDLLIEIKNRYTYTSVIIMTAFPSTEFKKEAILRGSLHFIEKPFDINALRDMVAHALREDNMFKGTVSGVGLTDVIQIKGMSRVTSALRVKDGEQQGIIYFDEGQIIHAICDDLEGEEAFYRILEFKGGVLDSMNVSNFPSRTIDLPIEALLIEGARRFDEANAGISRKDEEFNLAGLDKAEDLFVSANNKARTPIKEPTKKDGGKKHINHEEDEVMAELKDVLTEFTNIPGVNTACLVGRDGFLLDSIAISGIDTEMIGAIASSGFGASESMGAQLGKGGMSMSMIEYDNGPVMLSPIGEEAFLVIVAEKEANLGMIRLKIKKHSREIASTAAI